MNQPTTTGVGRGGYGRACMTCFKAKTRCLRPKVGAACVRCSRLAKECVAAPAGRRTNLGQGSTQAGCSKTAKIEQKLDSLVAILQSRVPSTLSQNGNLLIRGSLTGGEANQKVTTTSIEDTLSSTPFSSPTSLHASTGDTEASCISQMERDITSLSGQDAENALDFFRCRILPAFPFMHIPASSTARAVCKAYPSLWLCIISITSKSLAQKRVLGDMIRKNLAQGILVDEKRNLDLLLACIAYMGWVHHHMKEEPRLTTWVRLATTVILDLRLNQSPADEARESQANDSVEKRRAVLGAYLTSSIVCNFQNSETLFQWTPYMEDCLQDLAHAPQWIGDKVLVSQIKFHRVIDQIPCSLREKLEPGAIIPFAMALHGHLQEVHTNLSQDLKQNNLILLYFHSVKLLVDEIEFNSYVPDAGKININANASPVTQMQRLQCLHRCLGSVDAWCSTFFSMSSDVYFESPFAVVSHQLSRILKMLVNLTFLCESGWDCNEVRAKVDLFDTIEIVASGLDRLQDLLDGDDGVEGQSVKASRALRLNKSTIQAEFLSRQQSASGCAGADGGQYNLPELFCGNAGYPLNIFLDNQWTSEAWESVEVGEGWVASE
ncbi:uncharacterized protein TrAtP1_012011 [Trichoderma atroviride]|uniref:uncharacterized protein n=1 Tax=Hypocrea atroviridis TaxID=63577 RepID=UPI003320BBBA|nr:hypothetical protein TrAtP1_012011 [Trichoderma atroviride]